ncbi:protein TIC 100 [Lycium ferocissimum]|uniref:protein TIC 100 n=1 Tax=Lycium ferocissimum TaxID=112874 RepID=UPI002815F431|nr:protein TIC 100 [Lycium ferocissimum]
MLRKCVRDPTKIVPASDIQVTERLTYEEVPVAILDRQVRKLRNKEVASVKVLWRNDNREEMTWEAEEAMKIKYPYLFPPPTETQGETPVLSGWQCKIAGETLAKFSQDSREITYHCLPYFRFTLSFSQNQLSVSRFEIIICPILIILHEYVELVQGLSTFLTNFACLLVVVREERGPYSDPQHPYLYEEDDMWMAPGFINQFHEVPDYWKAYVHDVDEEREMWLNSFIKAPLRLPMPAELEYWWANDQKPEFVLLNKEPEPDPEDPSKLVYTEEPVILHTPTGRIINYVEDEEHGVRLFWQPPVKDGEDVDPDKVQFLPLGFDEFYGRGTAVKSDNVWKRFVTSLENACKPMFEKMEKWTEEKKKAGEMKMELLKKEFELAEAELSLKEALEDMDEELKRMQEEEEKKVKMGTQEEDDIATSEEPTDKLEKTWVEKREDEEEEEEEDEEEGTASSFGFVDNQSSAKSDKKDSKAGKAPFGASSLSFAAWSLVPTVPPKLQHTFTAWKGKLMPKPSSPLSASSNIHEFPKDQQTPRSISFPLTVGINGSLRAVSQGQLPEKYISKSRIRNRSKQKTSSQIQGYQEELCFNILSLHTPLPL